MVKLTTFDRAFSMKFAEQNNGILLYIIFWFPITAQLEQFYQKQNIYGITWTQLRSFYREPLSGFRDLSKPFSSTNRSPFLYDGTNGFFKT